MASWKERTSDIKVNDTVMYVKRWLQSTGQYTGDICFAKGIVKELKPLGSITLAVIEWDKPDLPEKVAISNLCRVTEKGVMDRD